MSTRITKNQSGSSMLLFITIILAISTIAFGGLAVWAYTEYQKRGNDVNGQIKIAVVEAEKAQQDQDEKKFAEREKEPNRDFSGPVDYGRVSFKYPKTWSVYVASDSSRGGNYEAYLNPITVPKVSENEQFALRVTILTKDYDQVIESYKSKVNNGQLSTESTTSQGNIGTRYDGNFSPNIRGSAVVYQIRDKTLVIRTDSSTYKNDFDEIVKTVTFNP